MLTFIDANCMIGRRNVRREGSLATLSEYTEVMDRCGIEKTIVYHCIAKENDPLTGNSFLDRELPDDDRFIRQWVVMPGASGEFIPESDLLSELKKHDIRTVRIFPTLHNYSLMSYASGKLIRTLAEEQVPIFLDKSDLSWDEIYSLCTIYPEARFVLCDTGYRCGRQLIPLMEVCDNLMIDTSTFLIHNGIRDFCRKFGAERILFGSKLPDCSASASVSLICYADISEEEKRLIASGNILRLLDEVRL